MTVAIYENYRNMFECLKAVYDDKENLKYKPILTYIFYDKEREKLVATNGKTMLIYTVTPELKDFLGQFENVFFRYEKGYLTDCKVDKDYVSWWRVVPSKDEYIISNIDIVYPNLSYYGKRESDKDLHYYNFAYAMRPGYIYNHKYFKKLDIRFDRVKHYEYGKDIVYCIFENENAMFLIMNMRVKTKEA